MIVYDSLCYLATVSYPFRVSHQRHHRRETAGKLQRKYLSAAEQFGFSGLKLVFRKRSRLLELRKLL